MTAGGFAERFWARVEEATGDRCWLWTGSRNNRGYGVVQRPGHRQRQLVHRVAFELAHGDPIAADVHVCHTCDTPLCARPSHLFLGTRSDNMRDMDRKGRRQHPGTRRVTTRLTDAQVAEIRRRRLAGERAAPLAREFGIAPSYVPQLVSGKRRSQ